ncbi:MAG: flippase [Clostridiales bacterium]|nr:flippase [Clostridiales bacterium]
MSGNKEVTSLAKNAVFSVIYRLLHILFPLISYGYVARKLTSDVVGRHAAAVNNVSYFVILGSLGIQAYATREIARRKNDKKERDKLFSEMLIVGCILTAVAACAFSICMGFIPLFRAERSLYLICAITIVTNMFNVDWYFQGTEDFKFIAFRSLVVKIVSLIAVFIFIRTPEDIYKYALIGVLTTALYYFLSITHAGKDAKFSLRGAELKRHLLPLFFLALCTVSTELYARMDVTMLDVMKEHSTVASYSYAQKIVNLIVVTLIAVTAVFLPRLSYYFSNEKEKFNKLTKFGADLMIFISIPMCLGLAAIASPLVSVWLGAGYEDAVPCLIILAFMIPLKCIGDIVCYQVMMCAGQESFLMIAYMITLLVNVINNLLLIPRYGAFGASAASLISEIIVFAIVIIRSKKYQNYRINLRNLVVTTISSLAMFGAVIGFSFLVDPMWLKLVGGVILGGSIFAILNLLLKNDFITREVLKAYHSMI